ncbi:hypothetical protein GCM10009678_07580 [Actinomadura kijaniata]|uniref:Alcohol dehydrogenase class IV n=1 Tax=Actinomadura namibiensis TaxID=182080 RepID=A0A7W3LW46_ACTNM|nr:alcohol dehydrogenase class IV [Actinomadura namibiensis]
MRTALVVTDAMKAYGIAAEVYDGVHVEPADAGLRAAAEHARGGGPWKAFVAVGGGSGIDTAEHLNPPVGGDRPARADMALAATFAGLGFGNAGVHVPHGMAVAPTAPEAFRFTFQARCGSSGCWRSPATAPEGGGAGQRSRIQPSMRSAASGRDSGR